MHPVIVHYFVVAKVSKCTHSVYLTLEELRRDLRCYYNVWYLYEYKSLVCDQSESFIYYKHTGHNN